MILIVEKVKVVSEDIIEQEGWNDNRHFKDEYEDYLNGGVPFCKTYFTPINFSISFKRTWWQL